MNDINRWAMATFGNCDLGDERRTRRLVNYATLQAIDPGASTNSACKGDDTAAEGAYRLIRNPAVDPRDIDDGVFDATAAACAAFPCVLAIQDTTDIVAKLYDLSNHGSNWGDPDGLIVHSTLAASWPNGEPIGLLDQARWRRDPKRGSPQKKRPYQEKESFKWEAAQRRIEGRVVSLDRMVTVADRESDIFEYLSYLVAHGHRFVVRAHWDRSITDGLTLRTSLSERPVLGVREVAVQQRGPVRRVPTRNQRASRSARMALTQVRSGCVTIPTPQHVDAARFEPITINVVWLREEHPPKSVEPLDWLLLTTEDVSEFSRALDVVSKYETRWLIEDFHQAWKSGCRIEERPLETYDSIERMCAITAPMAVRLLQMRFLQDQNPESPCDQFLAEDEWKCLHCSTKPDRQLPDKAPSMAWASDSIARLGGWRDTKRTGAVGWKAMWRGWYTLQERVSGWRAAIENQSRRKM